MFFTFFAFGAARNSLYYNVLWLCEEILPHGDTVMTLSGWNLVWAMLLVTSPALAAEPAGNLPQTSKELLPPQAVRVRGRGYTVYGR
jgi:hypothetical protein